MKSFSTKMFFWDKEHNRFSQEASSLQSRPGLFMNELDNVFPDSTDKGFTLVSHVTGEEVTVALTMTDRHEGDIVGWWFTPIDKRHTFKVLIIND